MKLLILLTSICGVTLSLRQRNDPLVSTNKGMIRGLRDKKGYSKYLGVPYGIIDGKNVFGAAVPHPGFNEIFEANDDSKICAQLNFLGDFTGTTDCLNLNIYVPDTASAHNRLPVMVYIHGGAFISGSATAEAADPHSLLRHDVIVVAINYRLGVYGFMCLDIPEVPGNMGLKDQVMALMWINEHIDAFGGDYNKITVFGQNAGGMSTNLHLFSSYESLFQSAIIQSGPAFSYWMMVDSDKSIPIKIVKHLGLNTSDIKEALTFMAEIDAEIIIGTASYLMISNGDGTNQPLTKPCIEKKFEGVENFITEHPMNIRSDKIKTTSLIIGYNNIECAFQYANKNAEFFDTFDLVQLFALGFDMKDDMIEALVDVKHFYVGDEVISENVKWEIIDFGSDFLFNHPTQRMANKLLESGAKNVYYYLFSYNGDDALNKTWNGATHGEELSYLFDFSEEGKTELDQIVVDKITKLFTNFAKYDNPTPGNSEVLPIVWTPISTTNLPYLDIDSDLSILNRPFRERMAFWDLFYKRYGKFQKWYKDYVMK